MKRENVTLADALDKFAIRDGDLLLFRGAGFVSRLISNTGRGEYSHAAKVLFWGKHPFCVEVREWHGGRAVTLESQVKKYPGRIDVYRTNPRNRTDFAERVANNTMRLFAGQPYGWWSVVTAALGRIPFVRSLFAPPNEDVALAESPPFCSQAVAIADRSGGVDPVPNLGDRLTEPNDLARSHFYEYTCTLKP